MTRPLKLLLCVYVVAVYLVIHFAVPPQHVLELLVYLAGTHLAAASITFFLCRSSIHQKRVSYWPVLVGTGSAALLVYVAMLLHYYGWDIFTPHYWIVVVPNLKGGWRDVVFRFVFPLVTFTVMCLLPALVVMAYYRERKRRDKTLVA